MKHKRKPRVRRTEHVPKRLINNLIESAARFTFWMRKNGMSEFSFKATQKTNRTFTVTLCGESAVERANEKEQP